MEPFFTQYLLTTMMRLKAPSSDVLIQSVPPPAPPSSLPGRPSPVIPYDTPRPRLPPMHPGPRFR